jgi:hypothetical protein
LKFVIRNSLFDIRVSGIKLGCEQPLELRNAVFVFQNLGGAFDVYFDDGSRSL